MVPDETTFISLPQLALTPVGGDCSPMFQSGGSWQEEDLSSEKWPVLRLDDDDEEEDMDEDDSFDDMDEDFDDDDDDDDDFDDDFDDEDDDYEDEDDDYDYEEDVDYDDFDE